MQNTKPLETIQKVLGWTFIFYAFSCAYPVFFTHFLFFNGSYYSFYGYVHATPIVVNISYLIYTVLMITALIFFSKNLQNNKILSFGLLYLFLNYILVFLYFIADFTVSMKTINKNSTFFEYAPSITLIFMALIYVFLMREFIKNSTQKAFKIFCFLSVILQILALVQMLYFGLNETLVLNQSSFLSMSFEILALLFFVIACCKFIPKNNIEQE